MEGDKIFAAGLKDHYNNPLLIVSLDEMFYMV